MRLANEYFKGKTVSFVQRIIGTKPTIIGRWWFEGKIQQVTGPSKANVFDRIKRIIASY